MLRLLPFGGSVIDGQEPKFVQSGKQPGIQSEIVQEIDNAGVGVRARHKGRGLQGG